MNKSKRDPDEYPYPIPNELTERRWFLLTEHNGVKDWQEVDLPINGLGLAHDFMEDHYFETREVVLLEVKRIYWNPKCKSPLPVIHNTGVPTTQEVEKEE